jgi:hypothetical protein
MTAPAIDLTQYANKKVLVRLDADDAELGKGTVTAATVQGILFKPYGKASVDLIPASRVKHIELQPISDELTARRVNPVTVNTVKRHLVDRHGYKLADVNAMQAEAAFEFHENTIDHSVLGHYHAEPPVKEEKADDTAEAVAS